MKEEHRLVETDLLDASSRKVRVCSNFLPKLSIMQELAVQNEMTLLITSSYREPGKKVQGAIVKPAKLSAHHIGHAVDLNLKGFNGKLYDSAEILLEYNNGVKRIRDFIDGCIDSCLRWGGNFKTPDPVHFDDGRHLKGEHDWLPAV